MSVPVVETPAATAEVEGQAPVTEPEAQKPVESETPAEEEAGKEEEPEFFSKDYVKALRDEAASYRVQLRAAEEALNAAKTPEEVEAAVASITEQNHQLRRDLIAERHKLPAELKKVLTGTTDEELEAHAKELAQFVPKSEVVPTTPPVTPGGGLGGAEVGSGDVLPDDPGELAARLRPRRFI